MNLVNISGLCDLDISNSDISSSRELYSFLKKKIKTTECGDIN